MRLNFRQGIIRALLVSGQPSFLEFDGSDSVNIVILSERLVVSAAYGDQNFIHEHRETITAWGPFLWDTNWGPQPPTWTNYLFWDWDLASGQVTRGFTPRAPTFGPTPPIAPEVDQHWFDYTDNKMKVWSGLSWEPVIRVFAGSFTALGSTITHYPLGSQVALAYPGTMPTPVEAGWIVYGMDMKALTTGDGRFFTSVTQGATYHGSFSSPFKMELLSTQAVADESIPAYYCVSNKGNGQLILASGSDAARPPIGIVTRELLPGEADQVVYNGLLYNDQWNWDHNLGKDLYCGANGELVQGPPGLTTSFKVASIIGPQIVLVSIGVAGVSGASGTVGTSGFSGFSGAAGFIGADGISGYSGYSGISGASGISIVIKGSVADFASLPLGALAGDLWVTLDTGDGWVSDGAEGWTNVGWMQGPQGTSGFSGWSGFSGDSTSGFSGFSGVTGASGFSGFSGTIGNSGFSGFSGVGISGFSGFSGAGASGFSGYSGAQGASGFSGIVGASGFSGDVGASGFSGFSGVGTSGFSGFSGLGLSGYSGFSGEQGSSGFSGTTGASGFSGFSGVTGESGFSGFSGVGTSGFSGYSGAQGISGFSGIDGQGSSGFSGYSGTIGAEGASGFSGYSGVGTSGFSGYSGAGGSGFSGYSGAQGTSGFSGTDGSAGTSGFSGFSGTAGSAGTSGFSGYSGAQGTSGFSGTDGSAGTSGFSGFSGVDGQSGFSGYSGSAGASGFSGFSGVGESGFSGFSGAGASGFSGFSGAQGASGFSGTDGSAGVSGFSGFSGTAGASGFSGYSGVGISGFSGYSGGPAAWTLITSATTATPFSQYIADTSGGPFTLDLPATPSLGDTVAICDGSDFTLNNLTVGRNGSTIEGATFDITIDYKNLLVYFTYDGTTWQVAVTSGPRGLSGYSGYSGSNVPVVSTPAYSSSMSIDWTGIDEIRVILSGNLNITSMTGGVDGKRYMMKLKQSNSGSNTLTVSASNVRYSTDIPSITLSVTADFVDRIVFQYDATDATFDVLSVSKGFA